MIVAAVVIGCAVLVGGLCWYAFNAVLCGGLGLIFGSSAAQDREP